MSDNNKKKIIVIVGPTASGKSDLAIKIAKKINGEIISADSRQVYKSMDIGTGKVSGKEQQIVKHHLIDVANPKKIFTANDFKKLAKKALFDLASRSKMPVIVGGTGFYIDALLGRIQLPEVSPNKKLRAKLEKQSAEQLFERLQKLDPQRSETIEAKNKRRLVRALEIILTTGQPVPTYNLKPNTYNILWLGLKPDNLEKKIERRLRERLKQGMIAEVKKLYEKGVGYTRLESFGLEYRQISLWLKNQNAKIKMQNESVKFKNSEEYEKLLKEIIKYSKRQMTWFKKNKEIHWIKNFKEAVKLLRRVGFKLTSS